MNGRETKQGKNNAEQFENKPIQKKIKIKIKIK